MQCEGDELSSSKVTWLPRQSADGATVAGSTIWEPLRPRATKTHREILERGLSCSLCIVQIYQLCWHGVVVQFLCFWCLWCQYSVHEKCCSCGEIVCGSGSAVRSITSCSTWRSSTNLSSRDEQRYSSLFFCYNFAAHFDKQQRQNARSWAAVFCQKQRYVQYLENRLVPCDWKVDWE